MPALPSDEQRGDWRDLLAPSQLHPIYNNINFSVLADENSFPSTDPILLNNNYEGTTSNRLIPLYCGMMGLIIVGLTFYVIYKRFHLYRKTQKQEKHCGSYSIAPQQCASPPSLIMTKSSISKYPYPRHDRRHMTSLPERALQQVKVSLCENNENKKGWKSLAKELGYAPGEIVAFSQPTTAVTAAHGKQPSCCEISIEESVEAFLRDWLARDSATIGRFTRALHHVQRNDIITIIMEHSPTICTNSLLLKKEDIQNV